MLLAAALCHYFLLLHWIESVKHIILRLKISFDSQSVICISSFPTLLAREMSGISLTGRNDMLSDILPFNLSRYSSEAGQRYSHSVQLIWITAVARKLEKRCELWLTDNVPRQIRVYFLSRLSVAIFNTVLLAMLQVFSLCSFSGTFMSGQVCWCLRLLQQQKSHLQVCDMWHESVFPEFGRWKTFGV